MKFYQVKYNWGSGEFCCYKYVTTTTEIPERDFWLDHQPDPDPFQAYATGALIYYFDESKDNIQKVLNLHFAEEEES